MITFKFGMTNEGQSSDILKSLSKWTRTKHVYLGLGSNLGDRAANLDEATERIEALGVEVSKASSIYETEPVGFVDQPWFLNQAIEVRIDNNRVAFGWNEEASAVLENVSESDVNSVSQVWIFELFLALQNIEREMGRHRGISGGPRLIDIDVLIYGDAHVDLHEARDSVDKPGVAEITSRRLVIPHPRMHKRRFVLEPLCEIAPDLTHPILHKTCREILASLEDESIVMLFKKQ